MKFLSCLFCFALPLLQAQPAVVGSWLGELTVGSSKLRLRLNVSGPADLWKATLDSLDQGAMGIPVGEFTVAEGVMRWKIPALAAHYEGTLNPAMDTVAGTFTQGGASFPLELKRVPREEAEAAGPRRPQTPKPPFPYRTEEVTFPSKNTGVKLTGTLTRPAGEGPHRAIVLVSGSGPQDRDETLAGHKPFAVLADFLTRKGIAVLRYDDRGVGKSTGSFAQATTADFADDAEGAFDFLRSRPGISKAGIGGHSEGATAGAMVAARRAEVAFVVLLAGTGVPGDQVLLAQAEAILRAGGASDEMVEKNRKVQEAIFASINADEAEMRKAVREKVGDLPGAEQTIAQSVQQARTPWFRYFVKYDPAPDLEKVKCPALVLNGDLDRQVLSSQNLPAIEAALRKGGARQVTVKRFPKLNHLFQTATTGSPAEYGQIEETMAPEVLELVANWVNAI